MGDDVITSVYYFDYLQDYSETDRRVVMTFCGLGGNGHTQIKKKEHLGMVKMMFFGKWLIKEYMVVVVVLGALHVFSKF